MIIDEKRSNWALAQSFAWREYFSEVAAREYAGETLSLICLGV
jgi:hypothetical protein